MKKALLALITISLILLSACSNDITAKPITGEIIKQPIDPLCKNIICPDNRHCEKGQCVCNQGKLCNGKCISKDACCSNKDCELDELCENNACKKQTCALYQTFDHDEELCICDENSKWCSFQEKCVLRDSCCRHTECGFDQRCVDTKFYASVCIEDERSHCKSVIEGRREIFTLENKSYEVTIEEILEDEKIKYNIDNTSVVSEVKGKYTLNSGDIVYIEKIELLGGFCKPDY